MRRFFLLVLCISCFLVGCESKPVTQQKVKIQSLSILDILQKADNVDQQSLGQVFNYDIRASISKQIPGIKESIMLTYWEHYDIKEREISISTVL